MDNKVTKNYIILKIVKWLGMLYKKKTFISVNYDFKRTSTI